VRAYIVRRLLLMIPTLIGVTLVAFLVQRLAPGDPLQMQLSQTGSQGESSVTREAYLHQRRQWKLDKPLFFNFRYFKNYRADARLCARFRGLPKEEIGEELSRLADLSVPTEDDTALLKYLKGLGIENFEKRLRDPALRADLAPVAEKAFQIRVENLGDHGVKAFAELLEESNDLKLRIGAIKCLVTSTFGDPFVYTYSKDPVEEETEAVVTTWTIWWKREREKFKPLTPERQSQVEAHFRTMVEEPSRQKIIDGMKGFSKGDAPFLMERLGSNNDLKSKYVASLALKSWIGKPLRVDVKLTDSADRVAEVGRNWTAYFESNRGKYEPEFFAKAWYILTDTQYANTVVKLFTFSFGKSMVPPNDPVGPKIWDAIKVSVWIMLLSQLLIYAIAVPTGIVCAITRGRWQDRAIAIGLFVLYSVPSYVAAMVFLSFFCYGSVVKIFPMYGIHSEGYENFTTLHYIVDYLWHIFLPVVCMSVFSLAGLAMYSRTSMLDVVNQDYIRTARAKGLSEGVVILKHALRNALIPVITLFSNFLPALLGGAVIIESLFGIPGMGRMSFDSITGKDYNTLMALLYIDAIVVMISILLTDLLYVVVDPRISFERMGAKA